MPTSQRKIDANRRNAAHSTAPRTPEGKAKSSRNAVTHGITAKTLCLSTENPEQLLDLMDDYFAELQPATRTECDLVEVLIASVWRLRRARRHETALLDVQMAVDAEAVNKRHPGLDNACREALAFKALCDQSNAWQNLERYQTRLRRDWLAAHAGLRRMRAERDEDTPPPSAVPPATPLKEQSPPPMQIEPAGAGSPPIAAAPAVHTPAPQAVSPLQIEPNRGPSPIQAPAVTRIAQPSPLQIEPNAPPAAAHTSTRQPPVTAGLQPGSGGSSLAL